MASAFLHFAVGLKAVAEPVEKPANDRGRDLVSLLGQRACELTQAQRRPQQRLHRIAARGGLDQRLQIAQQRRILINLAPAAAPGFAHAPGRRHHAIADVRHAAIDRGAGKTGDARHRAHAPMPHRQSFHRRIAPPALLIENRRHLAVALSRRAHLRSPNHPPTLQFPIPHENPLRRISSTTVIKLIHLLSYPPLALLLACGWVLFGVTSTAAALSGFASSNWVLVVSVLIIGAAITQTGVLYRLALVTITHMRGGFAGEATALACFGQLLGPAVPNATSRIIIIAPMLRELIDALGYAPRSKPASGLSMVVLIGFGQLAATTLTSSTTAVLVAAVLPPQVRGDIN